MTEADGSGPEIWERHPIYPHEGSSLGRARTLDGKILSQRPNNRPRGVPPEQRYRLMDVWMPRPPCYQENGKWVHLKPGCKCRETVSVHVFITECHWGLKKYRRQVARHRVSAGGGAADNRWVNLKGWGWPEDNEHDKPEEVRVAAARTARAAQLAASGPTATQIAAEYLQRVLAGGPRPAGQIEAEALGVRGISPQALWRARRDLGVIERRLWQLPAPPPRGARYLPWSPRRPKGRHITAGSELITKPVTKEVL
jgi:hypothetical protein